MMALRTPKMQNGENFYFFFFFLLFESSDLINFSSVSVSCGGQKTTVPISSVVDETFEDYYRMGDLLVKEMQIDGNFASHCVFVLIL